MGTTAQIAANRLNARCSTGPRTAQGKAASSRNAVRHYLSGRTFVLLPGEDLDAFNALASDYRAEFKPATPHEAFLVEQMIQARWRLDRIARMEAEAFDQLLAAPAADGRSDEGAIVRLYPVRGEMLDKLQRYCPRSRTLVLPRQAGTRRRSQPARRNEAKCSGGKVCNRRSGPGLLPLVRAAATVATPGQNEPNPNPDCPAIPDSCSRYSSSDARLPLHAS